MTTETLPIYVSASAVQRSGARQAAQDALESRLRPDSEVWISDTLISMFPPLCSGLTITSPLPETPPELLAWIRDHEAMRVLPMDMQDDPEGICFEVEVPTMLVRRTAVAA